MLPLVRQSDYTSAAPSQNILIVLYAADEKDTQTEGQTPDQCIMLTTMDVASIIKHKNIRLKPLISLQCLTG